MPAGAEPTTGGILIEACACGCAGLGVGVMKYMVFYDFVDNKGKGSGRKWVSVYSPINTDERYREVEKMIEEKHGYKKVIINSAPVELKG